MIVVIVLAAIAVMALAAIAGAGRFGEWSEPVTDRPKGHLPDGPVDGSFVAEVKIPNAMNGYDRDEVDGWLAGVADGDDPPSPEFAVRSGGYDMQFVDAIVRRVTEPNPSLPASDFAVGDKMGTRLTQE